MDVILCVVECGVDVVVYVVVDIDVMLMCCGVDIDVFNGVDFI